MVYFFSEELEKTESFYIYPTIYTEGGESQMRKGDKGMKLFGVFVFLLVIDSRI